VRICSLRCAMAAARARLIPPARARLNPAAQQWRVQAVPALLSQRAPKCEGASFYGLPRRPHGASPRRACSFGPQSHQRRGLTTTDGYTGVTKACCAS
jgi:hypothetical protein